jgi:transcription initiation factor IIE alpha subunit
MPESVYYFCRNMLCGHRGRFVAQPEEKIRCPKCDRDMTRQDVGWAKIEGKMPGKEGA